MEDNSLKTMGKNIGSWVESLEGQSSASAKENSLDYNNQAKEFDKRAGLSGEVCREIALAVLSLGGVKAGQQVVEVGVGTGEIGWHLIELLQTQFKPRVAYLGFDLSEAMLEQFQHRFQHRLGALPPQVKLLQADGNQPWPVEAKSSDLIFSSRTIHLLALDRVVAELLRLASPAGASFIMGSVERDQDSIPNIMQKQMRSLLEKQGFQGRNGKQKRSQVIESCCQKGGEAIAPIVVAEWTIEKSPRDSLTSWQNKSGLAGMNLSESIKNQVIKDLEKWAEKTWGNLAQTKQSKARYILEGVRFPSTE